MAGFYPGSKRRIQPYEESQKSIPSPRDEVDLGTPKILGINGRPVEFYTVGSLASALNRKTVTIRKWEMTGIIPEPTFISPSPDPRGQRRLYTESQILGLREIARQEGLLYPSGGGKWPAVTDTDFAERALQLWKQLEDK
jgi:MerR HTH family regulatory protein